MRGYASLTKCLPSGLPPGATRRFVAQSFSGCARNCCERAGIRPAGILRRPLRRSRTLSTAVAEHCFDIAEDIHPQPRVRTSNSTQHEVLSSSLTSRAMVDGPGTYSSLQWGKAMIHAISEKYKRGKSTKEIVEATDLLLELVDEIAKGCTAVDLRANVVNLLLKKGMKYNSRDFVLRADRLLWKLDALSKQRREGGNGGELMENGAAVNRNSGSLLLDSATPNIVIMLWADIAAHESPKQISQIVRRLSKGETDPISFSSWLNAIAKSEPQQSRPRRCEKVLNMMAEMGIDRTDSCYNAYLDAWAKSGLKEAPQRAEALLLSMQEQGIQPDYRSFTSVIDCWAKSKDKEAPKRAEDLLRLMQELDLSGMPNVRPTKVTFNVCINALAKASLRDATAAGKADNLLQTMKNMENAGENVAPDRISYSAVISAYSRVKGAHAADRAVGLLREMSNSYNIGNYTVSPDTMTYNAVLRTLGNQDRGIEYATQGEAILKEMEALYEKGHESAKPDIRSYNALLTCCILHGKRKSAERRTALRIALETFTKIRNGNCGVTADSFTFSYCFKAFGKLSSGKESDKLIAAAFKWCCASGMLNDRSLESLKASVSQGTAKSLLGVAADEDLRHVTPNDLPCDWRRNTDVVTGGEMTSRRQR